MQLEADALLVGLYPYQPLPTSHQTTKMPVIYLVTKLRPRAAAGQVAADHKSLFSQETHNSSQKFLQLIVSHHCPHLSSLFHNLQTRAALQRNSERKKFALPTRELFFSSRLLPRHIRKTISLNRHVVLNPDRVSNKRHSLPLGHAAGTSTGLQTPPFDPHPLIMLPPLPYHTNQQAPAKKSHAEQRFLNKLSQPQQQTYSMKTTTITLLISSNECPLNLPQHGSTLPLSPQLRDDTPITTSQIKSTVIMPTSLHYTHRNSSAHPLLSPPPRNHQINSLPLSSNALDTMNSSPGSPATAAKKRKNPGHNTEPEPATKRNKTEEAPASSNDFTPTEPSQSSGSDITIFDSSPGPASTAGPAPGPVPASGPASAPAEPSSNNPIDAANTASDTPDFEDFIPPFFLYHVFEPKELENRTRKEAVAKFIDKISNFISTAFYPPAAEPGLPSEPIDLFNLLVASTTRIIEDESGVLQLEVELASLDPDRLERLTHPKVFPALQTHFRKLGSLHQEQLHIRSRSRESFPRPEAAQTSLRDAIAALRKKNTHTHCVTIIASTVFRSENIIDCFVKAAEDAANRIKSDASFMPLTHLLPKIESLHRELLSQDARGRTKTLGLRHIFSTKPLGTAPNASYTHFFVKKEVAFLTCFRCTMTRDEPPSEGVPAQRIGTYITVPFQHKEDPSSCIVISPANSATYTNFRQLKLRLDKVLVNIHAFAAVHKLQDVQVISISLRQARIPAFVVRFASSKTVDEFIQIVGPNNNGSEVSFIASSAKLFNITFTRVTQ